MYTCYTGPDFKQTGDRLKPVIHTLFDHTCRIIAPVTSSTPEDPGQGVDGSTGIAASTDTTPATTSSSSSSRCSSSRGGYGMTLVYDKEWSSARLSGGMSFA